MAKFGYLRNIFRSWIKKSLETCQIVELGQNLSKFQLFKIKISAHFDVRVQKIIALMINDRGCCISGVGSAETARNGGDQLLVAADSDEHLQPTGHAPSTPTLPLHHGNNCNN